MNLQCAECGTVAHALWDGCEGSRVGPACSAECLDKLIARYDQWDRRPFAVAVALVMRRLHLGKCGASELAMITNTSGRSMNRMLCTLEAAGIVCRETPRSEWDLVYRA